MQDYSTISGSKVQSLIHQHSSPTAAAKLRAEILAMITAECRQAEG
jgi:hypothetical protein